MKIFYFDLETTGVNPQVHGIHQISGMIEIDGEIKEKLDFHVAPNQHALIDKEALKIAGVTHEQILAYPPMREVYRKIIAMLSKYVDRYDKTDKFFLCGYNNAAFDNQFFRGFFAQNYDNYFGSWFWSNSLDVMVLATLALADKRAKLQNFKLATVAEAMGVKVEEADLHDAMYDIYLTKEIFDKIRNQ